MSAETQCAWRGCEASFNGDLPYGWVWLVSRKSLGTLKLWLAGPSHPPHAAGPVMIFYHFTDLWCIDDIMAEGLKPAFNDDADVQPKNVVWLTTRDDQQGMWRNPKEVRITLVIPSTDRRLVRWVGWAREHDPDAYRIAVSLGHTGWEAFYCYFGTVPVSYLRAVEYADPERRA